MTDGIWRKAIPESRDRIQSRVLVSLIGAALVAMSVWTVTLAYPIARLFPAFILGALVVSIVFSFAVWKLRAATAAGAACGGTICLLITYWTGAYPQSIVRTALTPLTMLFVITFVATRAGKKRKTRAGLAEGRRGRTASQVIANLSIAALCVTPAAYFIVQSLTHDSYAADADLRVAAMMRVMCLAALVEATADTVSSEIGQAYGGTPRMLLSLLKVQPGTDGAVTALGTIAGIVSGFLVAEGGAWAMHLSGRRALIAALAGSLGLFFDSLLGATAERKGWLGNDLVNFISTLFASAVAGVAYWLFVN